jgi:hypothetical protein
LHSVVKSYDGDKPTASGFRELQDIKNTYDEKGNLIYMVIDTYSDEARTVLVSHTEYNHSIEVHDGATLKPSDKGYKKQFLNMMNLLARNLDRGSQDVKKEVRAVYNDLIKQMPKGLKKPHKLGHEKKRIEENAPLMMPKARMVKK